jgi:hypothetical protein
MFFICTMKFRKDVCSTENMGSTVLHHGAEYLCHKKSDLKIINRFHHSFQRKRHRLRGWMNTIKHKLCGKNPDIQISVVNHLECVMMIKHALQG